ncbi:hypothetical protein ACIX1Y_002461 [Listeria innocua]|uniref:hypothetical protein n=1 Tax=Listeria innocua TaxID=1642 RepID=UPI0010B10945|nr:hypothetical protein [Listeria innocua]EAD5717842.1 hypothetical protein [Listeria innocua]UPH67635.1 hypothetical protein EWI68_10020 [Listeria innocua]HAA0618307.1 hypothetical protein [Listeria innocua]HBM3616928.1 hypothetical protein [Listeria innocua]HBM3908629.1 hypothetical protein [Listeria innocua]
MKKSIIVIIGLLIIVGLMGCTNDKNINEKQIVGKEIEKVEQKSSIVSYNGKYLDLAENIEELEESSPIIVTVTKRSEKKSITKESKNSNVPTEFYTMSEVVINNIEKDETKTLEENKTIKVLEDSVENVKIDGQEYDLTIDGYKNMKEDEEYTLFIRKSTSGDNYVLTNAMLSKYPVAELSESELFLENEENREEGTDMKDTYKDIYKEVLSDYN